jgi:hypothetical protein
VFILQKTDVKAKKGRKVDSLDHPAEDTQRQTLKKAVLEGFWAKKRLALYCQGKGAL